MQVLISLAVITAARLESILSSVENSINYWIELELQAVHWKPTCLTTGGCANPRFRISKSNKFNAETISVSWSITENFVERHSRKFITHWMNGKPHEITLQCDVIGMDPLYGFSRTCDTTQNIEIFKEKEEIEDYPMLASEDRLSLNEQLGKLIVEIRAKCFNASFAVQKYMKLCPWCSEQDGMTLIESAPEYESDEQDATNKMDPIEKFIHYFTGEQPLLLFLLSLSLISLLGLICSLLIIRKQRHFISMLQKPPQILHPTNHLNSNTYLYSEQLTKPAENSDDRYDIPWDQKCILQRFWINEKSNTPSGYAAVDSKILNRTSTPTLRSLPYFSRRATITGTISTMSKHFSPNSSLYEHHEDSGLDSV
uniref:C2 domain-containing protein n=1 Tax=Setaria digitata TaxID=48799 RepID=A0A915Q1Y7_9BILA